MTGSRSLTVTHKTEHTSFVRGAGVTELLHQLELPRQFNRESRCWMTSRRSVNRLIDHAEARGWRVHVLDERQLTLDGAAS